MKNNHPSTTLKKAALTDRPLRHHEFDWIKVLVILHLVPFHILWLMSGAPGFSLMQPGSAVWGIVFGYILFNITWNMPLLFFLAGTNALSSLKRRSGKDYILERIKRLLIPLLFFMIFLYPVMVYMLPGASNVHSLSDYLLNFWLPCLKDFNQNWPDNIGPALQSWGHLWFIAYLLIISLIYLPLLLWLKKNTHMAFVTWITDRVTTLMAILIMVVPFVITIFVLSPKWPLFRHHGLVGDWTYFAIHFTAFGLGCTIGHWKLFQKSLNSKYLAVILLIAVLTSVLVIWMQLFKPAFSTPAYSLKYLIFTIFFGTNTWFWIMAAIGLSKRFLSHTNGFLQYFSRISYPFYILHLVVIVIIGFFVSQWEIGIAGEFLLLTVLAFAITTGLCELIIMRTRITRFLFGVK